MYFHGGKSQAILYFYPFCKCPPECDTETSLEVQAPVKSDGKYSLPCTKSSDQPERKLHENPALRFQPLMQTIPSLPDLPAPRLSVQNTFLISDRHTCYWEPCFIGRPVLVFSSAPTIQEKNKFNPDSPYNYSCPVFQALIICLGFRPTLYLVSRAIPSPGWTGDSVSFPLRLPCLLRSAAGRRLPFSSFLPSRLWFWR